MWNRNIIELLDSSVEDSNSDAELISGSSMEVLYQLRCQQDSEQVMHEQHTADGKKVYEQHKFCIEITWLL